MKVSIFNICSEWLEGLKFSTEMALNNAGEKEFDYVLILWNPSREIEEYLSWLDAHLEFYDEDLKGIKLHTFYYKTDDNLSFIENLRSCFN